MDPEYWKKIYNGRWKEGADRAKKITDLIEFWGFEIEGFGFLAESIEYSKESPSEKGIPDWKIKNPLIFLETTGTKYSQGKDDVWIRDDKFEYAENHPESECWLGHIVENSHLIRFMKLENRKKYPLEERKIRGITEKFRIILDGDPLLISSEEFRKLLESKKEKN